jgi:excisionase family DNA binding protein
MSALADEIKAALREVLREELPRALSLLQPRSNEDGYLSVQKAATLAEVHPDTIRAWVKDGRLVAHRAGCGLRIRRDDLRRFLEGGGPQKNRPTPEEDADAILARRRLG